MIKIIPGWLSVMAVAILLSGCASISSKWAQSRQVRFKVELSSLDYVQLSREIEVKGEQPLAVHLELDGSGYLECRVGRSGRVRDDFWQNPENGKWHDMRSDKVVLSREETRRIYQELVDAGVFDKVRPKEEKDKKGTLAILARMGFEKQLIVTSAPAFTKIFDELMAHFPGFIPN